MASLKQFERAEELRAGITRYVTQRVTVDKFTQADVLYSLTATLAMIAYIAYGANRAKARDHLGDSLDMVLNGIDEGLRDNAPEVRKLMEKISESGVDMSSVDRMMAQATKILGDFAEEQKKS